MRLILKVWGITVIRSDVIRSQQELDRRIASWKAVYGHEAEISTEVTL